MSRRHFYLLLRLGAIAGNLLFVLWLLFNGMDSGWQGSPVQIVAYTTLISLLFLNSYLLFKKH